MYGENGDLEWGRFGVEGFGGTALSFNRIVLFLFFLFFFLCGGGGWGPVPGACVSGQTFSGWVVWNWKETPVVIIVLLLSNFSLSRDPESLLSSPHIYTTLCFRFYFFLFRNHKKGKEIDI